MNNDLKIKIIGDDISNLFLALLLLKKGLKVLISKNDNTYKKINKEKLFFISLTTKLFLVNFNIWSQLKDKAYSIESLSIIDMSLLKKFDVSFSDFRFNKQNPYNIGWVISYEDLYDFLMNEICKFNDVFSDLNIKVNSELKHSYNNSLSIFEEKFNKRFLIPFLGRNNNSSIEFNASLRGYIDNIHYSIVSEKGLIFICPINNNLFRVKWIIKKSLLKNKHTLENSFLLDNLSTILPKELIIDQVFGDLYITRNYPDIFKLFSKSDNYFLIQEVSDKQLYFRLEGYDLSLNDVIFIFNQFININSNIIKFYGFVKFKFLILKFFNLKIISIFHELFIINNQFICFFKRTFLYLFKKVRIINKLILKFIILNF